MPNPSLSSFDQEATLEELAGIGRNPRFDEAIQDEELEDIEVVCRKLNPDAQGEAAKFIEIPLAKPARAFYFGDRTLYAEEAKRFDQEEKARILNTDQFRNNLQIFDELRRACQRGFVIPFVGAGMSKSAGLPEWKEYLLRLCNDAGLSPDEIRTRLEIQGDYEGVMNDIVERLTVNVFERDFERDFRVGEEISGPVTLLPKLFDCSVITTNFDHVLETVYANARKSFNGTVTGRGHSNSFFRAIPSGDRYLLKLHGNIDNATERVLNRAEYNEAYGAEGNVNMTALVPKLLERLFSSYSFFFLGCSLTFDRTIQTFTRVVSDKGRDNLPCHYALFPAPADPGGMRVINQRMADANITPLWYPEGEHEHVEQILTLLLD